MENCVDTRREMVTFTPGMIMTTIILGTIILVVLLGNSLVITAVIRTRKLRTVTNLFIMSLACSDLLLGVLVLPFSTTLEVLDFWPFGNIWCSMWLAIDVLVCTASILNLCAISLDRYLAVTQPIQYPRIMSRRRGKILVASVWMLSFLISFPPLIGWSDRNLNILEEEKYEITFKDGTKNTTWRSILSNMINVNVSSRYNTSCRTTLPHCELVSGQGYRIYSSLGSFYIPMFVMVFFYCKIYLAAVRTASSIRSGILTSKRQNEFGNSKDNDTITLRVHRGGSNLSKSSSSTCVECKRTCNRDYPDLIINVRNQSDLKPKRKMYAFGDYDRKSVGDKFPENGTPSSENDSRGSSLPCSQENSDRSGNYSKPLQKKVIKATKTNKTVHKKPMIIVEDGKPCQKQHIRKFLRETKAAKTVAIIVGAFIMCWLPFFIIYIIGAFCEKCTPKIVFSIMFWLGYCNSMLNPFIYALFSRDFRYAFKRILFCGSIKRPKLFCSNSSGSDPGTPCQKHFAVGLESESLSDYH